MSKLGKTLNANWNRISELTANKNRTRLQETELRHRVAVQNHYAATGEYSP